MTDTSVEHKVEQQSILIAEDDEEIRRLLGIVFQLENYAVLEAEDGNEALRLFTENVATICLVITDLGLPGLGGVDLIERIRALSPTVKIIGASGYGKENIRDEVLRAGANEFMSKPFNTGLLIDAVHTLLNDGQ